MKTITHRTKKKTLILRHGWSKQRSQIEDVVRRQINKTDRDLINIHSPMLIHIKTKEFTVETYSKRLNCTVK